MRRAYKFAYSDCIEVGPVACLPEPPDPNELYPRQSRRCVLVLVLFVDYRSGHKQLWGLIMLANIYFSLIFVQLLMFFLNGILLCWLNNESLILLQKYFSLYSDISLSFL